LGFQSVSAATVVDIRDITGMAMDTVTDHITMGIRTIIQDEWSMRLTTAITGIASIGSITGAIIDTLNVWECGGA
jgi:hypothetical protein